MQAVPPQHHLSETNLIDLSSIGESSDEPLRFPFRDEPTVTNVACNPLKGADNGAYLQAIYLKHNPPARRLMSTEHIGYETTFSSYIKRAYIL